MTDQEPDELTKEMIRVLNVLCDPTTKRDPFAGGVSDKTMKSALKQRASISAVMAGYAYFGNERKSDGVALYSTSMPEGLLEKTAQAIRDGRLK